MVFIFAFLCLNLSLFSTEKRIELNIDMVLELGKEDLMFGSIASVCEDNDNNFYVLDRSEHKVFKFSPEGKLILTFGQKGQGPGDFQNPHLIAYSLDNQVVVADELYDVSFMNPDGTFIKRVHLDGRLGIGFVGKNSFYAWIWQPEDRKQVMVDSANNIVQSFFRVPKDAFSVASPDISGRLVMFNYSREEYVPSLLFAHFGRYSAVAIGDQYTILILDEKGETVSQIQRDIQPDRISKREKRYLEKDIEKYGKQLGWPAPVIQKIIKKIPERKIYFDRVLLTESHVFVFRVKKDIADEAGQVPVDVFSIKGEFLGSVQIEDKPVFISDRYMYFQRADKEGNLYLEKAKYRLVAL